MARARKTPVPANFEIEIMTHGLMPDESRQTVVIRASGRCTHRSRADQMGAPEEMRRFQLPPEFIESIHAAVERAEFFKRRSRNGRVIDGDMVLISAVSGSRRHQVALANSPMRAIDVMVRMINGYLPAAYRARYNALREVR